MSKEKELTQAGQLERFKKLVGDVVRQNRFKVTFSKNWNLIDDAGFLIESISTPEIHTTKYKSAFDFTDSIEWSDITIKMLYSVNQPEIIKSLLNSATNISKSKEEDDPYFINLCILDTKLEIVNEWIIEVENISIKFGSNFDQGKSEFSTISLKIIPKTCGLK